MKIDKVKEIFRHLYAGEADIYLAPGRINLIGEHTDYNDGFVLPAAIDKHVIFGIKDNGLNTYRFHAIDLQDSHEADMENLEYTGKGWPNYLLGVIDQMSKMGHIIPGFDCVVTSDIPIGAGLSSSAALETGLATGLNELFDLGISDLDLVKLSQRAENEFVGVNCGIMDQFTSVFGRSNHVFRLDCRSLDFDYFPLNLEENGIILVDTKVKHSLGSSEYNTRRKECETGVAQVARKHPGVKSLRDVTMDMLDEVKEDIDPIIFRRCAYVVGEIDRVVKACDDLQAGHLVEFGRKMYETHAGLSVDYEVSCEELDFLVDATKDNPNILGSRMMGGGFGGCTINILHKKAIPEFKKKILEAFQQKFNHSPVFYEVLIDDGVRLYVDKR